MRVRFLGAVKHSCQPIGAGLLECTRYVAIGEINHCDGSTHVFGNGRECLPSSLVFLFAHAPLFIRPRQTLGNLTCLRLLCMGFWNTTSPSALKLLTKLYQASGSAVLLTACVMPCVRFNRLVSFGSCLSMLQVPTLGLTTTFPWTPPHWSPFLE